MKATVRQRHELPTLVQVDHNVSHSSPEASRKGIKESKSAMHAHKEMLNMDIGMAYAQIYIPTIYHCLK